MTEGRPVYMRAEDIDLLKQIAEKEKRPMSAVVRRALEHYRDCPNDYPDWSILRVNEK